MPAPPYDPPNIGGDHGRYEEECVRVTEPVYMGHCPRPFPTLFEVAYAASSKDHEQRRIIAEEIGEENPALIGNLIL